MRRRPLGPEPGNAGGGKSVGQVRSDAKFVCEVGFVFALVLLSGVSGCFGRVWCE